MPPGLEDKPSIDYRRANAAATEYLRKVAYQHSGQIAGLADPLPRTRHGVPLNTKSKMSKKWWWRIVAQLVIWPVLLVLAFVFVCLSNTGILWRSIIVIFLLSLTYVMGATLMHLGMRHTLIVLPLHARQSLRSKWTFASLVLCCLGLLLTPIMFFLTANASRDQVTIVVGVPVLMAVFCLVTQLLPPVALVLGASHPNYGGYALTEVVDALRPLKAVSLLRPDSMPVTLNTGIFPWRYRTSDPRLWERQVSELLNTVALIVADVRAFTSHVDKELALLAEQSPDATIMFVCEDSGATSLEVRESIQRVIARRRHRVYVVGIGVVKPAVLAWRKGQLNDSEPKAIVSPEHANRAAWDGLL